MPMKIIFKISRSLMVLSFKCCHHFTTWSLETTHGPRSLGQSAEYVKYAKIFGDYFWLIFIPTEDLGNLLLVILCLLKILATISC